MGLLLSLALVFRTIISSFVFHIDSVCQAGWGQYLYFFGSKTFFTNTVWTFSWPNHPPLTSLLYGLSYRVYFEIQLLLVRSSQYVINHHIFPKYFIWLSNLANFFNRSVSPEIPFPYGFFISMKIWPILGDILLAILIYYLAKKITKKPIIYPLLYLTLPFSWYLSALWGQTDQLSYLFTLLAFILLPRQYTLSLVLLALGAHLKPTSVMFFPYYIYLLYLYKPKIQKLIVPSILCLILTFAIFKPFYTTNIIDFFINTIIPKLFFRAEFRVSTNAYNFWHIFTLDRNIRHETKFFLLSYKNWGFLIYFLINIFTFKKIKKLDIVSILTGLFVVSAGSWLFLTNMLDRYFFTAVVTAFILTIYDKKLFKFVIPLITIYCLNLFRHWWYPESLSWLRNILEYQNALIGSFLSFLNVFLYILISKRLFQGLIRRASK